MRMGFKSVNLDLPHVEGHLWCMGWGVDRERREARAWPPSKVKGKKRVSLSCYQLPYEVGVGALINRVGS